MSSPTPRPGFSSRSGINILKYFLRFILLMLSFFILFSVGGTFVSPYLPDITPEPGPVNDMVGLLIISVATILVIVLMILSSRWHGWKLIIAMSLSFYGIVTFLTQVESWLFLTGSTISAELMPRLFLQGMPVAFIFIPLAVVILGRARKPAANEAPALMKITATEWIWKLVVIIVAYEILYWCAGYFIAFQNPELRAFYGQPGEILSFFDQLKYVMANTPGMFPFQALRALLWTAFLLPLLWGSRWNLWQTALVVSLLCSVPQNVNHILSNPLIPLNSVRLSHLAETAPSSFIFGLIVTWLLYPKRMNSSSR